MREGKPFFCSQVCEEGLICGGNPDDAAAVANNGGGPDCHCWSFVDRERSFPILPLLLQLGNWVYILFWVNKVSALGIWSKFNRRVKQYPPDNWQNYNVEAPSVEFEPLQFFWIAHIFAFHRAWMRQMENGGGFDLAVVWFHSQCIHLFYKVAAAGWATKLNTNKTRKKEINYLNIYIKFNLNEGKKIKIMNN